MMKLNTVIKTLAEFEEGSRRKGFGGDAINSAFKRYVLILLQEIAESAKGKMRKKRKPSAWNLFVAKYLREGRSIQDAAKDWKKR